MFVSNYKPQYYFYIKSFNEKTDLFGRVTGIILFKFV